MSTLYRNKVLNAAPTLLHWGGGAQVFCITVQPPIKDPPYKGHNRKNLPIKDTFPGPAGVLITPLIPLGPLKLLVLY